MPSLSEMNSKIKLSFPLIGCIVLFVIVVGIQIMRSVYLEGEAKNIDSRWLYIGGRCWLNGLSPYNEEHFYALWKSLFGSSITGHPYAYPPTSVLLSLPLALFPWNIAAPLQDWLNVLFLMGCFFFIGLLITSHTKYTFASPRLWIGLALGATVSMISAAIYTGQTPLFSLLGCLGALYFADQNKYILGAFFVVLATTKPQFAAIPLLLIALQNPRLFLLGMAFSTILTIMVFFGSYESDWFHHFFQSIKTNVQLPENGFYRLTVAYRLLNWLDITEGRSIVSLLGLTMMFLIWRWVKIKTENNFTPTLQILLISLAFALTGVFMPLHNYDLCLYMVCVAFIPFFSTKWIWMLAPGTLLLIRPSIVLFIQNQILGMDSNWTKDELTINIGTVYFLIALLLYLYFETTKITLSIYSPQSTASSQEKK